MRRSASLVLVVLAAAVLGGAISLARREGDRARRTAVRARSTCRPMRESSGSAPTSRSLRAPARCSATASTRSRIYAARSPGVVTVFAFFDKTDRHGAQGSGFVVSESGYILTSAHVITDAGESDSAKTTEANQRLRGIQGRRPGQGGDRRLGRLRRRRAPARVARKPRALAGSARRFVPASRREIPVAAMGSPFGNEDSIAVGVVSATRALDHRR